MTDQERLAEAAAYGRRLADETLTKMDAQMAHQRQVLQTIRDSASAPPFVRPDPNALMNALRQAFEDGPKPPAPSRPHLKLVKS